MVDCDYCGEDFEEERELRIHWMEEHEDEITSHEKDKAKKAKREKEEEKQQKIQERKQMAGFALAGLVALGVVAFVGSQIYPSIAGPSGEEVDVQEMEELLEDRPVIGAEDADVTVVEFGDYLCPHCRDFEFNTKEPLADDGYFESGDVNFYYLHLPVVDPTGSPMAGVAAECVANQDREAFWDYTTALFQNQQQINYNSQELTQLAEENTEGLDYEQLDSCISNQDTRDIVDTHESFARSIGATGTPTVFINGNRVSDWSYGSMRDLIDAELERQQS